MARQTGAHITFLTKTETTYGTLPTGNWEEVPILDFDPGVAADLENDPAIGMGHREMLDPFRKARIFKPKLTVPVDLRNIGRWLKLALGNYAVAGSGPYTHTFKAIAASALPSFSLEAGYPDANSGAGKWLDYTGCVVDTFDFDISPSGTPKLVLGLVAQNEAENTATQGGTPTIRSYTPFSQIQGTFDIDTAGSTSPATTIPDLTGATLKGSNNVDAPSGAATQGLIIGADGGQFMASGDAQIRLDDMTLFELAASAGFGALAFGYKISSTALVSFVAPRISWAKPSVGIKGPGGVDVKYAWQASRDPSATASIIVTLINDVPSY
jgi:hypothetical protein